MTSHLIFIDQCTYSEMFPANETDDSTTKNLTSQDQKDIEEALNGLEESDKRKSNRQQNRKRKAEGDNLLLRQKAVKF